MEHLEEMNLPMLRSREPPASIEEVMMLIRIPAGKVVCAMASGLGR